MENNIETLNTNWIIDKELFTEKAISTSALLGGPLAAIYFIAKNFNSLGKNQAAKRTWLIGLSIFLIVFLIIFNLPDNIVNSSYLKLLQFLWTIPTYFIVKRYQQNDIQEHLERGWKKGSGWKIFSYSLIALFVTALFFITLSTLTYRDTEIDSISITELTTAQMDYSGCKVYYDSLTLSSVDAKVAGSYLEQIGYFNPSNKNSDAIVTRSGKIFTISIAVDPKFISSTKVDDALKLIINDIQRLYKDRIYQFRLIGIDSVGIHEEKIVKL